MPPHSPPLRLVCLSNDDALRHALEAVLLPFGDAVRLTCADPKDPDPAVIAAADALLCGTLPAAIRSAADLRWVQLWSVDVPCEQMRQMRTAGIEVATASVLHADACAERVLAGILAFAGVVGEDTPLRLKEKTVGIAGAGTVGQAIGVRCRESGMRTVGMRREPSRGAQGIDHLVSPLRYHDLVLASDFIVLALPLTPDTRMIFGEDEIEICKKTACVLNVGRGGLIDERYLLQALRKGWIAGAALDRFADEPLAPEWPFWTLSNCVVTPGVGENAPRDWPRFARLVAERIERGLRGTNPPPI